MASAARWARAGAAVLVALGGAAAASPPREAAITANLQRAREANDTNASEAAAPADGEVQRYGPDKCVSVQRSDKGHCVMSTACADVPAANMTDYEFGIVCVNKDGTAVRHMFGKNSFDPVETFDTLIPCEKCMALDDVSGEMAMGTKVSQLEQEVEELKSALTGVAGNVSKLVQKVLPEVHAARNPPAAPAPASKAEAPPAAEEQKALVHHRVVKRQRRQAVEDEEEQEEPADEEEEEEEYADDEYDEDDADDSPPEDDDNDTDEYEADDEAEESSAHRRHSKKARVSDEEVEDAEEHPRHSKRNLRRPPSDEEADEDQREGDEAAPSVGLHREAAARRTRRHHPRKLEAGDAAEAETRGAGTIAPHTRALLHQWSERAHNLYAKRHHSKKIAEGHTSKKAAHHVHHRHHKATTAEPASLDPAEEANEAPEEPADREGTADYADA